MAIIREPETSLRVRIRTAFQKAGLGCGYGGLYFSHFNKGYRDGLAELRAEVEKLRGIILLFDNYCRVNDIDMEQFLKS